MIDPHGRSDRHDVLASSGDSGDRRVGRRSYLKLAGVAAGSIPLLSTTATATTATATTTTATTVTGTTATATTATATTGDGPFDRTVNAAAAGCDPSGRTPCDRAFRRAIDADTLLSFPAGTYRFTEPHVVLGVETLGLVGEGDVTFVVPPAFNANLLTIAGGSELLVRGIDIDMTAPRSTSGLRLCAHDHLVIEDVSFTGSADASPNGPAASALSPVVRSSEGVGIVRNVVAVNDGPIGNAHRRNDGRAGIRIGGATRGSLSIENCRFEGFPNGGAYVSETAGRVRIDGGVYRDNDVAGIRIGGTGTRPTVANARVEVAPRRSSRDETNACGIRFEGGGSGCEVTGCDVRLVNVESNGAIVAAHDYGGFTLRDTRIRVDNATRAVYGFDPHGGRYSPPRGSLASRFERCSIVGPKTGAIRLTGRPMPDLTDCSLDGAPLTRTDVSATAGR